MTHEQVEEALLNAGYRLVVRERDLVRHPDTLTLNDLLEEANLRVWDLVQTFGTFAKFSEALGSKLAAEAIDIPDRREDLVEQCIHLLTSGPGSAIHPADVSAEQFADHLGIARNTLRNIFGGISDLRAELLDVLEDDETFTIAEPTPRVKKAGTKASRTGEGQQTRKAYLAAGLKLLAERVELDEITHKLLAENLVPGVAPTEGAFRPHWKSINNFRKELDSIWVRFDNMRPPDTTNRTPAEQTVYAHFQYLGYQKSEHADNDLSVDELEKQLGVLTAELAELETRTKTAASYKAIFKLCRQIGQTYGQLNQLIPMRVALDAGTLLPVAFNELINQTDGLTVAAAKAELRTSNAPESIVRQITTSAKRVVSPLQAIDKGEPDDAGRSARTRRGYLDAGLKLLGEGWPAYELTYRLVEENLPFDAPVTVGAFTVQWKRMTDFRKDLNREWVRFDNMRAPKDAKRNPAEQAAYGYFEYLGFVNAEPANIAPDRLEEQLATQTKELATLETAPKTAAIYRRIFTLCGQIGQTFGQLNHIIPMRVALDAGTSFMPAVVQLVSEAEGPHPKEVEAELQLWRAPNLDNEWVTPRTLEIRQLKTEALEAGYHLLCHDNELSRHPDTLLRRELSEAAGFEAGPSQLVFRSWDYRKAMANELAQRNIDVPSRRDFLVKQCVSLVAIADKKSRHPEDFTVEEYAAHLGFSRIHLYDLAGHIEPFRQDLLDLLPTLGYEVADPAPKAADPRLVATAEANRLRFVDAGLKLLSSGTPLHELSRKLIIETVIAQTGSSESAIENSFTQHWHIDDLRKELNRAWVRFDNTRAPDGAERTPEEQAVYAYFQYLGFKNAEPADNNLGADELGTQLEELTNKLAELETRPKTANNLKAIFKLCRQIGNTYGQLNPITPMRLALDTGTSFPSAFNKLVVEPKILTVKAARKELRASAAPDSIVEQVTTAPKKPAPLPETNYAEEGARIRRGYLDAGLQLLVNGVELYQITHKLLAENLSESSGSSSGAFRNQCGSINNFRKDLNREWVRFDNTRTPENAKRTQDDQAVYAYFQYLGFKNAEPAGNNSIDELETQLEELTTELATLEAAPKTAANYRRIFNLCGQIGQTYGRLSHLTPMRVTLDAGTSFTPAMNRIIGRINGLGVTAVKNDLRTWNAPKLTAEQIRNPKSKP